MSVSFVFLVAAVGLMFGGNSLQAAEKPETGETQVEKAQPACPLCGVPLSEETSKRLEEFRADREKLRQEIQKFREKWGRSFPLWGRAFLPEEAAKKLEELRAHREKLRQEAQKFREKWGGGAFPWGSFGRGRWEWGPPLRGFHRMPR